VLSSGQIGLIDYGQVKQISGRARATLASVMLALASRTKAPPHAPSGTPAELAEISRLGLELGVELVPGSPPEGPAAVAMWLFDDASETLPGGFEQNELSPKSPVTSLAGFPQDLVLVARAAVLIKGIAAKLELDWSLAERWAPLAQRALDRERAQAAQDAGGRVRFRAVLGLARAWAVGRLRAAAFAFTARKNKRAEE
jgi:aarF domain-containing kinase